MGNIHYFQLGHFPVRKLLTNYQRVSRDLLEHPPWNIPQVFFDDNSLGLYSYTWDYTIWLFNIAMENQHF